MIVTRFLLAFIFLKSFDKAYAFLLSRCGRWPSPVTMQSFDFSSAMDWDEFYKKPEKYESMASQDGSSPTETETTLTEWHPSVSLEDIASVVPPNGKCLIIGCGNSNLPDVILKQRDRDPPRSLVLLDTSQTCLNQLRERHLLLECSRNNDNRENSPFRLSNTAMEYVCGDVTQLSNYFGVDNFEGDESIADFKGGNSDNEGAFFDIIIDKGLTDALLCGEGWDGPLEKLLYESAKVLSMETGQYLLVSYELPSSTKQFLVDIGHEAGLKWDFDFDLITSASQDVNVAMATRTNSTCTQRSEDH